MRCGGRCLGTDLGLQGRTSDNVRKLVLDTGPRSNTGKWGKFMRLDLTPPLDPGTVVVAVTHDNCMGG